MAEVLNSEQIQQKVSQIVSSTCWPLCHFAFWELSMNRNLRCSCYVYWVTVWGNSIVCKWMYCDLVQYIIQLKLLTEWSVICRPLHLSQMQQQEFKKQKKVGKHYWRFVWFICIMDQIWGQFAWMLAKSFFFTFLRSKTKSMLLKMQKRVGQYRQEYQIQTCFVVCIKAVNFRLQLSWIIFWPDWKFFHT